MPYTMLHPPPSLACAGLVSGGSFPIAHKFRSQYDFVRNRKEMVEKPRYRLTVRL